MKEVAFTDLILLMGTNPLPNYVVAMYFLKSPRQIETIWIVYTEDTENHQVNLTKLLEEIINNPDDSNNKVKIIPVYLSSESDGKRIGADIEAQILTHYSGKGIHLNYTGGTKVMSIHVYRTIKENYRYIPCSFSYLSASGFNLIDDERGIITRDLRNEISISLENLIRLHAFQRLPYPKGDSFGQATQIYAQLIKEDKLDELFNKEKETIYYEQFKKIISPDDFERKKSELPPGKFRQILEALPKTDSNNLGSLKRYLNGLWLEDYIYLILCDNFHDRYNIKAIDKNLCITTDRWDRNNFFEIDLVMLNGYQFFGISCTASLGFNRKNSLKAERKKRGFEIILRTQQIGGEEAKAVLVGLMDDSEREIIEKELIIETGIKDSIMVLGREDLKQEESLIKRIKKFIKVD